jgi:hypothetical protein
VCVPRLTWHRLTLYKGHVCAVSMIEHGTILTLGSKRTVGAHPQSLPGPARHVSVESELEAPLAISGAYASEWYWCTTTGGAWRLLEKKDL